MVGGRYAHPMAKQSHTDEKRGRKVIAVNRRARYDYQLDDRFEAGLVLTGTEVKSLRDGKASLVESWVRVVAGGDAHLMQAHIPEYAFGNRNNHDPIRPRKLLLHRKEIDQLAHQVAAKGVSLIPTQMYFLDGRAKLEFAVAKGKNVADKRQTAKERDAKREIDRALKSRR